jgi:hypothetical protein
MITSGEDDWNSLSYSTEHHYELLILFTIISYQVISKISIYQHPMDLILTCDGD